MDEQIESLKPARHLATQAGCCHWAPIFPHADKAPEEDGASVLAPKQAESTVPPVVKPPD
jgi:hypothetical protein